MSVQRDHATSTWAASTATAEPADAEVPVTATTGVEGILTGVLADLLRVDDVPVDHDFFEELGADSLVMAHFCARLRKRGDLPSVSMQEVYQNPTIRRLSASLANTTSGPGMPTGPASGEPPTPTSGWEHILCGALQGLCFLAYMSAVLFGIATAYPWVTAGAGYPGIYVRLVLATGAALLIVSALPIVAKWVLIGRWRPRQIRLWSLAYVRFWIVKTLIRSSPAARLFIGTPLYLFYLRALGAKIGPGALVLSRHVPVCTDLLTIGAGTVIRRDAFFNGYRAQNGRIEIGAVTLGEDAFVGERSVLDIDTSMGDGAQLGHASSLHSGQEVPAGERWHGCPAQPTEVNYRTVPPARCGKLRRVGYSVVVLLGVLLLYLPLIPAAFRMAMSISSSLAGTLAPGASALPGFLLEAAIFSSVVFFGLVLVGLLIQIAVPRVLNLFLKPDTVYPLYGFHDLAHRAIARLGNMRFFTYLFGDSSYIVHYLQWLGYRLTPVVQTGSNFGIEVRHANPSLCSVGSGTMSADGLMMLNDEVSSTSFRLSHVTIGSHSFLGNDVIYPAGGRTGENVLLGTKAMVPLDGKVREGVGLLGSPGFEIPRTVERDSRFDHLKTGEELRRGLSAKNRYNLRTIGIFLFTRWLSVFLFVMPYLAAIALYPALPLVVSAAFFALGTVGTAIYLALLQRCIVALHPVHPTICSIYHPDHWLVERLWKVQPIYLFHLFDGTPFKGLILRLRGVRTGRRVFDDGNHISEPTLTAIGDECILNHGSKIQCHSQEDGTFKCDRTAIGAGCTIGVGAFVHYGVTMGDGAVLEADSFLMKGEDVPPHAWWNGNPASEVRQHEQYQAA